MLRYTSYAGTPEGNVTADPGSICLDRTNGVAYEKQSGVGTNTGWTLIPYTLGITKLVNGTTGQQLATIGTTPTWLGVVSAALGDSSPTIVVGTANQFILPVNTLSQNRTVTLGTAGAVVNESITIVRLDATAFTYAVVNGGAAAGTLYTFPISVTRQATFVFDGTNWVMSTTTAIA